MLKGKRGEVGIGHHVSAQVAADEKLAENVAVADSRSGYPDLVGVEPVGDVPPRVTWGERGC
ncbi:hypothetical protein [Actinomyces wuliandei]|uniref:hypothetical protein n=1 Tax=Actinomyces wuliandei TaxID=2057743 RepID=UPI00214CE699|nr:hypothetical protein [Actinomyces wuliandei]